MVESASEYQARTGKALPGHVIGVRHIVGSTCDKAGVPGEQRRNTAALRTVTERCGACFAAYDERERTQGTREHTLAGDHFEAEARRIRDAEAALSDEERKRYKRSRYATKVLANAAKGEDAAVSITPPRKRKSAEKGAQGAIDAGANQA